MTNPTNNLEEKIAEIVCPDLLETLTPQECQVMHPEIKSLITLFTQLSDERVRETYKKGFADGGIHEILS